ncbi:MAG: type III PLP-dependent enzyme [Alphaproteobacteria bacterium]|nr:type III PLP-dependent enzyme [Alphaproteobacteria bacterium]
MRARSSTSKNLALKARPVAAPLRNPVYEDAAHLIAETQPSNPVHLMRPHVLRGAAQWFLQHFPGTVLYAVKANPSPAVIKELWASGIRHFDVASLAEVELVAGLFPKAKLHFMHPVKSREAIRKSYFNFGVRDFVVDSAQELFKLLEETRGAKDLGIMIRLAVSNGHAFHSLTGKFGAENRLAAELLQQARKVSPRVGIAFHVGQQTMHGKAYATALAQVGEVIRIAKVNPDIIDVGGGFPVAFPGLVPPDMHSYMDSIKEGFEALNLPKKTKLWCEPGRALVQESGSLLVKVELRKDNRLYINDGFYGALFDAGYSKLSYPLRALRTDGAMATKMAKFTVFGPTCDSIDVLKTQLTLPADIEEGDYIEFGQTGGYAVALQSGFNGFGADAKAVTVRDMPLLHTPGFWQGEEAGKTAAEDDSAQAPATLVAF